MDLDYTNVIFDASFINQLYRINKACDLLEFFQIFFDPAICIVDENQYKQAPCNHFNHTFTPLSESISDEELIKKAQSSPEINKIDLAKISRDPVDVNIFIFAYNTKGILVLTCDKSLLLLCKKYDIDHCCFKNAVLLIDQWMNGDILKDPDINTDIMESGDDPFFHFNRNTRCVTHCGPSSICISYGTVSS
jgi:predicted nucleic acid-binding protein